jgi:hypothetical protein
MEYAVAEKTVYIPPLMLGMIILYRQFMYGFWYKHPILRPIVMLTSGFKYVADNLMGGLSSFMSSSQEKAISVRHSSVAILDTLTNSMVAVVAYVQNMLSQIRFQAKNVLMVFSNMTAGVYSIFTKTSDVFESIRFHFKTVIHQSYNFTAGMFSSLQEKSKESMSFFPDIRAYFFPKPKSIYEQMHIVTMFACTFVVIGLTVYYFSILRKKTVELPKASVKFVEPVTQVEDIPVVQRKQPVRRRAKKD